MDIQDTNPGAGDLPEVKKADSQDLMKNMKAEFDRKLSDMNATLQRTMEEQKQLLSSLAAPKQDVVDEDIEDVWFKDPKKAMSIVEKRVEEKFNRKLESEKSANSAKQAVITELVSNYPELNDNNNEMTKRVYELLGSVPSGGFDPRDLKMAALQAAQELDIKPVTKRVKKAKEQDVDEEDYFDVPTRRGRSRDVESEGGEGKLNKVTETWAQLLGLNTSDPKVKANLIKNSKRNWTKFS